VPVVSLVGKSLVSRMGKSILTNAGVPELAVDTLEAYEQAAIRLAGDVEALRAFRRDVRQQLASNGLGNATIFAREFEQACESLLERHRAGLARPPSTIPILPAKEIMRRAYEVLRRGNDQGAARIVEHCLRHHPDHGAAHLLKAMQTAWEGDLDAANAYLLERIDRFSPADRVSALLTIARHHLLMREPQEASAVLEGLSAAQVADPFDAVQVALTQAAACHPGSSPQPAPAPAPVTDGAWSALVVVPCDSDSQFAGIRQDLTQRLQVPQGVRLQIVQCGEASRAQDYPRLAAAHGCDAFIVLQKNIRVVAPDFLQRVHAALATSDVVGFAGARRWDRLDWRFDAFEQKAGCFMVPSTERPGMVDLRLLGLDRQAAVPDMAVLDGGLLAMASRQVEAAPWDERLLGCDSLLEEEWTHAAARAGLRLAVRRDLGVLIDSQVRLDDRDRLEAREHCAQVHGFDALDTPDEDHLALSVPATGPAQALEIQARYLAP
jgi:hypothetical protein